MAATTKASVLTLTDFLLARIAEDEAVARACAEEHWRYDDGQEHGSPTVWGPYVGFSTSSATAQHDMKHIARHDPARVLVECKAKRRIVAMHTMVTMAKVTGEVVDLGYCSACADWNDSDEYGPMNQDFPCPTLHILAAVYADHTDYRQEWRP